jgi:branched-chain amino acid transport system substrate-binding protein
MALRTNLNRGAGLLLGLMCFSATAALAGDKVIRIGVLNDMSSVYADFQGPGSVISAQMAVEDFGGTVAGKPIEVVSGDHQNKPDVGKTLAQKWFDEEGVDVIADLPNSAVALAVSYLTRERNKVILGSGQALPS